MSTLSTCMVYKILVKYCRYRYHYSTTPFQKNILGDRMKLKLDKLVNTINTKTNGNFNYYTKL